MKKIVSVVFVCLYVVFFNVVLAETKSEMSDAFCITVEGKSVPCTIKSMEVVTATRLTTPKIEIASSIMTITSEEIEKSKKTNVVELLKDLPCIDIAQTGGDGGVSYIYIRGAKPEHTLVMIDGIEMNDPMSFGRSCNLSNLMLENIEQIEIVKGPQSTLYGSDAMGGVINIITKKGQGRSFSLFSEAGSFKTFRERVEVGGGGKKFSYSLGAARIDTEGISSAGEKYGNTEKDGYRNTSLTARLTFDPKDKINIDMLLKYLASKMDLDNSGGENGDDPNYTAENKELYLGLQCSKKIGVSFARHNRSYNNDPDINHPDGLVRSTYLSQVRKINWQDSLSINKFNTILAGMEYKEERGELNSGFPQKKTQNRGYFLQDQINVHDRFFAALGARLDNYSEFGSKITCRIAPGYNINYTNTRIKASYATGFKSPSLYQLYSPKYGDMNLNPEKSIGWDAGLEQYFLDKTIFLDAVYFYNNFSNMVEYDRAASKYKNVAEAQTEGVELSSSLKIKDAFVFKASAAKLRAKDKTNGKNLQRRPSEKNSLGMDYHYSKNGIFNAEVVYTGERDDTVILDSYRLVNMSISHNIDKNLEVYVRANNIFDKDYEEVKGYGTPGASFYGGIKINY